MYDMKDSGVEWIGEIPKEWSINRFKYIASYNDENLKENEEANLEINYVEIGSVSLKNGIEKIDKYYFKDAPSRARRLTKCGDIIVSTVRTYLKAIATITENNVIVSTGFCVIRPNEKMFGKYVEYYCKCSIFTDCVSSNSYGISYPAISAGSLMSFHIIQPQIANQKLISNFLDKKCAQIDALITNQQKQIEKLKAYKHSLITEVVTKGLDPSVPMKDSGVEWIGIIPEGWSVNKITRCFETIGSGTTPKLSDDRSLDNKINWIQSGDINGSFLSETHFLISKQMVESTSTLKVYNAPFIVIAMYGASIGNLSISLIDACTNQACCVLALPVEKLFLDYVFYTLKPAKDYLIWKADGGGQPNISQDKVKNLWIPVPPVVEQHRIINYLNDKCLKIDRLSSIKQSKIDKLNQYKQSLIYEYVTGKREV